MNQNDRVVFYLLETFPLPEWEKGEWNQEAQAVKAERQSRVGIVEAAAMLVHEEGSVTEWGDREKVDHGVGLHVLRRPGRFPQFL